MIIPNSVVAATEDRFAQAQRDASQQGLNLATRAFAVVAPKSTPVADLGRRVSHLRFAGARPTTTELERLMGSNDLVDEFYLQRALAAAQPVMRITLRDAASRERGWATGFMVSPRLLLTNWHVFPAREDASNAIAEANYVLDIAGDPAPSYRFPVRADEFYLSDEALDFALVAVGDVALDGQTRLARFGYHRLQPVPNKIEIGEAMTLIQHPGGERRQLSVRENELKAKLENFLWYNSDTAPGSSGAPAFNDSFQVVALHHSGAAKKDAQGRYVLRDGTTVDSLDNVDDADVEWVANEGLRVSVLCAFLDQHLERDDQFARELREAMQGGDVMATALASKDTVLPALPAALTSSAALGSSVSIPLQLNLSVSLGGGSIAVPPTVAPVSSGTPVLGAEAMKVPIIDRNYSTRTGYDAHFLGVVAPLPTVHDLSLVAKMANGQHVLPYEHFSVVVNKLRRLPLIAASNLDFSPARRRPEPGDYTRKGLTGLADGDSERWITDQRIPQQDQLPDVFYNRDRQAFDKGHIASREDMSWGKTRALIVRAVGDTFHVTNCTPQVLGFNRARGVRNWGDLENEIQRQGKHERLSVLAGPLLSDDDRIFDGFDDIGPVRLQIPHRFWKIVLANDKGKLAAFAFVLEQDLSAVPIEFQVTQAWKHAQVAVADLESRIGSLTFAQQVRAADRFV